MKTSGVLLLVLLSTSSFAVKNENAGKLLRPEFLQAPQCDQRPEFLTDMRAEFVSNLASLPETVLVARNAEFYIEGEQAGAPIRLHGYQSFLKSNSEAEVLCGNSAESVNNRFALMAPTLIDTHQKMKVGQSLWQFQMMAEGSKYSFWNLKSKTNGKKETLEAWLKNAGANYKIYQRTHDEYELLIVKKDKEVTQYLSIRYDAVSRIKD